MKIRLLSDIHLEMAHIPYSMEPMVDDKDSTLVIAGDIGLLDVPQTYLDFLSNVSKQFKYVFWIGGNHEWYHGNIVKNTIEDAIKRFPNVFTNKLILGDENVAILGCTLWTDMAGGDEVCMYESERCMNDYHFIKMVSNGVNYHKFTAKNSMMLHYKQKRKLFADVDHYTQAGFDVVVATHHHPSFKAFSRNTQGRFLMGHTVQYLMMRLRNVISSTGFVVICTTGLAMKLESRRLSVIQGGILVKPVTMDLIQNFTLTVKTGSYLNEGE